LKPPYAMEEIPAADEESNLIEFPAEMVEAYEAIRAAQSSSVAPPQPVAAPAANAQATPASDAFSAESEINRLRNWLTELEDALNLKNLEIQNLLQKLSERDETLAVQNRELEELRRTLETEKAQRGADGAIAEAYQAAQAELRTLSQQFAEMQREYNELASTTLPDLLKDKEELVALLEEQTASKAAAESALGQCRRRLGYSYLVAASAAVLALLVPLFHGITVANREAEWNKAREALIADADQAKRLLRSSEEKSAALDMQLASAKRDFAAERDRLLRKNADLTKRLEEQAKSLAALKTELTAARSATTAGAPASQTSAPRNEGIVNLAETRWATRPAAGSAGAATANVKTRTAVVKAGDGLIRFLQRECGTYNDSLAAWVTKANNLKCNRQGEPILQPDQTLVVPVDPRAIDAAAQAPAAAQPRTN
ncbi:MAG: hypothetical protein N3A66_03225, partial [Planctomycetota bacterium]|nr:hypothetical protein [Planctomycetota bacterium]